MTPDQPRVPRRSYWEGRAELLYYHCVEMFVAGFAPAGGSIIDVGSNQSPVLEPLDWFSERISLDLRRPYQSEKVQGVKADFLQFNPMTHFDLALCLQVLEHVRDPHSFARKLFAIADSVIITVPYLWPEKSSRGHLHDLIDERTLERWTGRPASHYYVVQEPFSTAASAKARRLIAYYHDRSKPFSLHDANQALLARSSRAAEPERTAPSEPQAPSPAA